ncbi:hypothetical protein BSU01_24210 [Erwinia billingiae]|uniref:DUF4225 domain-containing protein n=1 Tax=Erwinia billingiae TaxID=182337 RepID=UPI0019D02924|nr:DUF4225 domain-containing protein [Erwinia billingiae]MBN7124776.1 hypothetical protein [Erwinia billingiae]
MDTALLSMMQSGGRNRAWAETMVNLEARKLVNLANQLAGLHLSDGLTRMKFVEEIRGVIDQQFTSARRAVSDEECIACISTLRSEFDNLKEQDRQLRMKVAKLYAGVEFVRENNKIVGYVISAVHVVVSGVSIFGGFLMISTMGPIGALAGATLIVDGLNGISREVINTIQRAEDTPSQGIFADAAMDAAVFMGFKPETGLAFYNGTTLSASVYSIYGLATRTGAWRLFRWMPRDYYRKVETMNRPKLTMKIVSYGVRAKVVFDLLTTDNSDG